MWKPGRTTDRLRYIWRRVGGHAGLAGMFLKRGTDATVQDKNVSTRLHLTSRWGRVEVTRMFLERGADVNAQKEDGSTPLRPASFRGHPEVERMVLELSFDVSAQNTLGLTPSLLASRSGKSPETWTSSASCLSAGWPRRLWTGTGQRRCIWRCDGDLWRSLACFWSVVVRTRWRGRDVNARDMTRGGHGKVASASLERCKCGNSGHRVCCGFSGTYDNIN